MDKYMKKLLMMLTIIVIFSCAKNNDNTVPNEADSDINNVLSETNFEHENINESILIIHSTVGSQELLNQIVYTGDISELGKSLTIEQLEIFSKDDLRILRNTIYAKYGYRFNSKDLQEHFSKFSWYNGISNNVDDKLTTVDIGNIELVQKAEQNYSEKNDSTNELIGNWYYYGGVASDGMGGFELLKNVGDCVMIMPDGTYVYQIGSHNESLGGYSGSFYGLWSLENNIFETIPIGEHIHFLPTYGKVNNLETEIFIFNNDDRHLSCALFGRGYFAKE
jgi:RNA recognition motif-containing protein